MLKIDIKNSENQISLSDLRAVLDDLAFQLQEEIAGRITEPRIKKDLLFDPGKNALSRALKKINALFGEAYESDVSIIMRRFNEPLKIS